MFCHLDLIESRLLKCQFSTNFLDESRLYKRQLSRIFQIKKKNYMKVVFTTLQNTTFTCFFNFQKNLYELSFRKDDFHIFFFFFFFNFEKTLEKL